MSIFTWKQRLYVMGGTVFSITLFGGGGYLLGTVLGHKEALLVLGLISSFPFNVWLLITLLKPKQ